MADFTLKLHPKQGEALTYLTDNTTNLFWYGGAAWWGKTFLGCGRLNMMCIAYPWSRWFIARDQLKRLKQSTLMTLLSDVHPLNGIVPDKHFVYKQQDSLIQYYNWSIIFLLDASRMPSDPMYQRFGSIEVCWWLIDEAAEVKKLAVDILLSRCRYKLVEFGLIPKVFCVFNPDKWRVYSTFYKPHRDWMLPEHTNFVPALATDNPSLSPEYLKSLGKLPEAQRQRLRYGNFDYDDTPWRLFDYDALYDMRTNPITNGTKYIICDPARLGEDEAVIMVFNGREEIETVVYKVSLITELATRIQQLSQQYKIPMRQTLVDADGVGWWLVDILKCKPFHNGASPVQTKEEKRIELKPNFENLKTQCVFALSEHYTKIRFNTEKYKELIIEELDVVVEIDIDKDGKCKIIKKQDIKEKLWRSPNYLDVLLMRCWFELEHIQDYEALLKAYLG